ncbi:hypothetical protein PFISCL1PPCAC_9216 [Pristionchus fissidentatus]|uniref:EB domain-containing protein n=1 Tax=Pristionchus fissidentatus TaxID=1538716 RepID=A0AAV5VJG1_9BILA|nr:hypothetical protein PFISCL1PPCAC_9216 [Pristionchus fissidentatus]
MTKSSRALVFFALIVSTAFSSVPFPSVKVSNQSIESNALLNQQFPHEQSGKCPLGQVQVNGQCLSLAAPGNTCQFSLQCIDKSTCINQICSCSNPAAKLIAYYCLIPGSVCSQTQTQVDGQCLTFTLPGSTCQYSAQCVGGSICQNKMCVCPSGTTQMYNYCISSSSPSKSCDIGQVQVNGECMSLAIPGSRCKATAQCLDSSTCVNNVCTCSKPGSVVVSGNCATPVEGCSGKQTRVNGKCLRFAAPGMDCTANEQCVDGSSCIAKVCRCPAGRSIMNGYCIPSREQ